MQHIASAPCKIPRTWKRPKGRSRSTWVSTLEKDLSPVNFGIFTALKKAEDSKLEEDHPFGDAPLVGACRQEEERETEEYHRNNSTSKIILGVIKFKL